MNYLSVVISVLAPEAVQSVPEESTDRRHRRSEDRGGAEVHKLPCSLFVEDHHHGNLIPRVPPQVPRLNL